MKLSISIVLMFIVYNCFAQSDTSIAQIHYNPSSKIFLTTKHIQNQLACSRLTSLIDNAVDEAHIHLSSIGDFDKPNPYLIAFTGSSYKWTKTSINNFRIDNILQPGDASYHLPLVHSHVSIQPIVNKIDIIPFANLMDNVLNVSTAVGSIGNRVGFTDWFVNNISGHRSAAQRSILDIKERPYSKWHFDLSFISGKKNNKPYMVSAQTGRRIHVDQDYEGISSSYQEDYLIINAHGIIKNQWSKNLGTLKYLFSYKERDNFGAEFQYDFNETAKRIEQNTSVYTEKNGHFFNQTLGITINAQRIAKKQLNIAKNVLDQDGEGLFPYYTDGSQQAFSLYFKRFQQMSEKFHLEIESYHSLINHTPKNKEYYTTTFSKSSEGKFTSLQVINWQANKFLSSLIENNLQINYTHSTDKVDFNLYLGLHLYGFLLRDKNTISFSPSLRLVFNYQFSTKFSLGIKAGVYPNRYDIDQIRFLSNDYLNGNAHYWNSDDADFVIEEQGNHLYNSGGKYHIKSKDLRLSHTYFLDIPINLKLSKKTNLSLLIQYRQFRNTWGVSFSQDESTLGSYDSSGDYWFQDQVIESYLIAPLDSERMTNTEKRNSFLFDQPFYAGGTCRIEHISNKWYISGSFTANMIVGYSGMGNGPLHNNINSPSESMAFPNFRQNQLGRLDSDRSFISRIIASYSYTKRGKIGVVIKYKDGQSFAYYDHAILKSADGNQISFTQPEVRGDDPITGEKGRREDFFTNVELHILHSFKIYSGKLDLRLSGFNLLDFANETSEYTFGNRQGFSRSPLELQIPRSIAIQALYTW